MVMTTALPTMTPGGASTERRTLVPPLCRSEEIGEEEEGHAEEGMRFIGAGRAGAGSSRRQRGRSAASRFDLRSSLGTILITPAPTRVFRVPSNGTHCNEGRADPPSNV